MAAQKRRDAVGYILPIQHDTYSDENNSSEPADSSRGMNSDLKNRKGGLRHGSAERGTLPFQTEPGSSEDTQGILLTA